MFGAAIARHLAPQATVTLVGPAALPNALPSRGVSRVALQVTSRLVVHALSPKLRACAC